MFQPGDFIDPYYLDAMAELIKQNKQCTYTWMHIQPGHSVLDVGCGPGIDTLALAELVGPTGYVVGVDVDAAMIAEANRRAEQAGCRGWCHHEVGDAVALPLETSTFDSCRSERLFQQQQFTDINVETRPIYFTNFAQFRYATQMDIVERNALADGFVTQEELNRWQQNLEDAETTGTFFAHATGVLVAGRKAKSTSS